jgi:SPP1 gp7 family putative phage head morphogenesis protein
MNLNFYFNIALCLENAMRKLYAGGNLSVAKLNKKHLSFSFAGNYTGDPFKIDYNNYDNRVLQNFRVECFTVAGVGAYELEELLKKLAEDIITGKEDTISGNPNANKLELFKTLAADKIAEYVPEAGVPPGAWLKTNLNLALDSSYNAAAYNRLQALKVLYEYYRYNTQRDNKVSEEHKALEGRIWRADDKIWKTIWPPNRFGCRCPSPTGLTAEEVTGKNIESSMGDKEYIDNIHKEAKIPPEFQRNPGEEASIYSKWLDSKLSGMPKDFKFQDAEPLSFRFEDEYTTKIGDLQPKSLSAVKDYAGYNIYYHDFNNEKIIKEAKTIVKNPAEVWGSLKKIRSGQRSSTINYIYREDNKFRVAVCRDAEIIELKTCDSPEEYRTGVPLIKLAA